MDFLVDNAVALSAIFLAAAVLISLAVTALSAYRLWRRARAAQRRVTAAGAELAAQGEHLTASLARLPERQAEIQASIEALSRRAAVLAVLAAHASAAVSVLRAPLRYLGR